MQNYSENSVTANSSLLSPTGCVKSISPIQENFHVKWLRRKRQLQQERWDQVWDQLQASTSTSPCTTPMTMLTSTIAWCTPCVELACRGHSFTLDVVSHLIGSSPESFHIHPWSSSWCTLFDSFLPFYFYLFLPVFSFNFLHSELYSELINPIVMESLCYSASKGSEDAYDVSTSLTSWAWCWHTPQRSNDRSTDPHHKKQTSSSYDEPIEWQYCDWRDKAKWTKCSGKISTIIT